MAACKNSTEESERLKRYWPPKSRIFKTSFFGAPGHVEGSKIGFYYKNFSKKPYLAYQNFF
jgi:hypothetical protein